MRVLHNICLALSAMVALTSAVELEKIEKAVCTFETNKAEGKYWVHPYWYDETRTGWGWNEKGLWCFL